MDMKRRILSCFLAFCMIFALLPAPAQAVENAGNAENAAPTVTATVQHAETGQITAQIEAYMTDPANKTRTVKPCDIIFLIEQSKFMNTQNGSANSGDERAEILNGGLTERHARCLLAEPDAERRMALIRRAAAQRLNVSQTEKLIAAAHKPKPHRAFIAKDIRLFLNTINHAVRVMNDAGVGAQQEQTESAQFMEIRIRIPKSAAPCV